MSVATLGALLHRLGRSLAIVAGAPDYERYLAHMRMHHPDEVPLSAAELLARRHRARLERPGGRCC